MVVSMIIRRNYRACLRSDVCCKSTLSDLKSNEDILNAIKADEIFVKKAIRQKKCLTIALYYHENMLFLYTENIDIEIDVRELFPNLSELLALWPEREGETAWVKMYTIYYHDIPCDEGYWSRQGKKNRRGRIAYLKEDKMFSYIYYHKAIVDEGLLEGDRYQFIALHEDILFSYFEEPKLFTHIRKEVNSESKVIKDWLAVNPESHFDHELSGEDNFLLLPELFSLGVEEVFAESEENNGL